MSGRIWAALLFLCICFELGGSSTHLRRWKREERLPTARKDSQEEGLEQSEMTFANKAGTPHLRLAWKNKDNVRILQSNKDAMESVSGLRHAQIKEIAKSGAEISVTPVSDTSVNADSTSLFMHSYQPKSKDVTENTKTQTVSYNSQDFRISVVEIGVTPVSLSETSVNTDSNPDIKYNHYLKSKLIPEIRKTTVSYNNQDFRISRISEVETEVTPVSLSKTSVNTDSNLDVLSNYDAKSKDIPEITKTTVAYNSQHSKLSEISQDQFVPPKFTPSGQKMVFSGASVNTDSAPHFIHNYNSKFKDVPEIPKTTVSYNSQNFRYSRYSEVEIGVTPVSLSKTSVDTDIVSNHDPKSKDIPEISKITVANNSQDSKLSKIYQGHFVLSELSPALREIVSKPKKTQVEEIERRGAEIAVTPVSDASVNAESAPDFMPNYNPKFKDVPEITKPPVSYNSQDFRISRISEVEIGVTPVSLSETSVNTYFNPDVINNHNSKSKNILEILKKTLQYHSQDFRMSAISQVKMGATPSPSVNTHSNTDIFSNYDPKSKMIPAITKTTVPYHSQGFRISRKSQVEIEATPDSLSDTSVKTDSNPDLISNHYPKSTNIPEITKTTVSTFSLNSKISQDRFVPSELTPAVQDIKSEKTAVKIKVTPVSWFNPSVNTDSTPHFTINYPKSKDIPKITPINSKISQYSPLVEETESNQDEKRLPLASALDGPSDASGIPLKPPSGLNNNGQQVQTIMMGSQDADSSGDFHSTLTGPNLDEMPSQSRSRRSWIWNQFFVIEEYSGPEPVLIGRLHSSVDKGDGRTKYILKGEGAGSVFVIDSRTGNIHVTKPLDREEKDQYRLIATATDRQTGRALEPSSQFIIRVQDINDNPPLFQSGPYSATVPEMANIGTSVIQVTATDADDPTYGSSAKLVYSVIQGQQFFTVDPQSGIVRTAVPDMDREAQAQYQVVLQARDMGGHQGGLTGTTTITVHLSDVNDNPPRFTQSMWSFSVSELAVPGVEIGRLSATDADLGENARMDFMIVDGESGDTFNITGLNQEAVILLNKVGVEKRKQSTQSQSKAKIQLYGLSDSKVFTCLQS
ncbi:uncharacterized protein cdh24a isoform X2 [Danio rerio]|uniref:Uncharacterized protein cdh24a isoform X2 n=1 Tax=Danio rerio TaxID=7955 RepID=A0AC58IMH4_DANRE